MKLYNTATYARASELMQVSVRTCPLNQRTASFLCTGGGEQVAGAAAALFSLVHHASIQQYNTSEKLSRSSWKILKLL